MVPIERIAKVRDGEGQSPNGLSGGAGSGFA